MHAVRHVDDPFLFAKLEAARPEPLAVGRGNAMFVSGWCFHRERRIIDLSIRANGATYSLLTHSMPRADVFVAHDRRTDPHGNRYRSGFWAIVPVAGANGDQEIELELVAMLSTGEVATRRIGEVPLAAPQTSNGFIELAAAAASDEPLIAVCMTTFNPPLDLFKAQVDSLRGQTHGNWICLVSDDSSRPDVYAAIRDELDGDEHFVLSQTEGRLGYYRNFERVLGLVPAEAALVSLCDQDDRWHPNKLESLRAALESGVTLAYSDMNLIDGDGNLISPTYWTDRRTNHTDMTSLLVANTITAAATMFPRRLLDYALPFPAALGHAFHDHWLAMVALATGRIAYVDRPLYDYVQHSANAFGSRGASWKRRDAAKSSDPQSRLRGRARLSWRLLRWRLDYFYNACSARLHAEILMMRCGDALTGRKRRAVKRMTQGGPIPAARRADGGSLARSEASTVTDDGAGAADRARHRVASLRRPAGAHPAPRAREPRPGPPAPPPPSEASAPPADAPKLVHQITRKITPLNLRITSTCEPRVNMLVPTIDLDHFFGAYIGKFNLARRLAEHGLRVRIVAVDPTRLPDTWRDQLRRYEGLDTLLDKVEVEFAPARELLTLEVNPRDCFIATTSWTAHLAHRATEELDRERFVFVIQEYDPLTYPVGTLGAVTRQAYTFPHFAVFSTELLRDYFRNHSIGVFAEGAELGDERSVSFRNAITSVDPPSPDGMRRQAASLLFYARPEEHAERNMFELGLMAIAGRSTTGSCRAGGATTAWAPWSPAPFA